MDALDKKGSGLLIEGRKTLETIQIPIYGLDPQTSTAYVVATYPMDSGATAVYQSRAGGFVPPGVAGDTCFGQASHYGQGFFEGMRFYDSPYGLVLVQPSANYARFMHSATVFHPLLARLAMENFGSDPELMKISFGTPLTPSVFYEMAEQRFREGKDMAYTLRLDRRGGKKEMIEVDMALRVAGRDGAISRLTMKQMDTIIKVLAYTGRLVSSGYFPQSLEMTAAGYIRPFGWVAGEQGLKVPSIVVKRAADGLSITNKSMYFAAATLPWGLYLTESDYAKGLDVMVSPYNRIMDNVMPANAKVAGNYVNSLMPINLGAMFGFGEILAFNGNGRFVEGSAENVFVFMQEGKEVVAYTPPIGDGCLPGTTRDRVIKTLGNLGIELRYGSLDLKTLYNARGILLTGTGAQMIHVRSITELDAAGRIAEAVRLRSEDVGGNGSELVRRNFKGRKRLINKGQKHHVIDIVQAEHERMVLESMLEPVHSIDFCVLAKLLGGLESGDFMTKKDVRDAAAGYFMEKVDGLKAPEDLAEKHRRVARIIKKAMNARDGPGVRAGELFCATRRIRKK
ncbi:MAG: aminotransferase class IV [Candidatus Micrarchaeota archaeon]